MSVPLYRTVVAGLFMTLLMSGAMPLLALRAPSKTASDQSLTERQADLARIEGVLAQEEVAEALAAHGLTDDQIHFRLSQLSPEELQALSSRLELMQAAGANVPQYIWILLAVFLGVLIVGAIL